MLYEMVSGRRPFRGDYDQAVIYSILNDGIEPLTALRTGVPPELDRIAGKCLARDKDERYQTAEGLIADLRHLKRTMEPGKAADAGSVSPRRRLRRLALIAPVALVAVLAAVYFSGALRHERGSGAGTTGDDGNTMIVVLPFENLGPPEEAYFADGITDAITARLAGLSGLGVISRQSAVQYRGSGKTSRQIGEELGVDYILEGTVQRERPGDSHSRVRIIPQLIRCSDDIHLWAGTYDGEMTEVFSLQSQIAEQVAGELDVKLLGGERTSLESRPTANLDAYDYYLKSLEYKAMWSEPENNRKCIGLLKKALEADPQFALAWTDLSTVYVWTYWTSQDEEGLVKAQSAVDRAIAIDRDLPEVELTLGFIQYYGYRDYDEAAEHFEAALARRPNYSEAFIGLGLIRRRQGRWEESLEHFERAARINPRDTRLYFDGVGYDLAVMHRFDEAERLLDRAIDMEPTVTISYFLKSSIILNRDGDVEEAKKNLDRMFSIVSPEDMCFVFQYVETGPISRICYGSTCGFLDRLEPENCPAMSDWEKMYRRIMIYLCTEDRDAGREALHFADSIRSVLPGGFPAALLTQQGRVYIVLGKLYAKYGRREDAIREAHRAEEAIPISEDAVDGPDILCEVIDILVMTGEYEAAFDRLDHLMSVPCNYTMRLFELDPLYEPLRDMPRYRELLEKYPAP
jgi:serine/threonine-protein kinase